MTVIAFDGRIVAADTLVTSGDRMLHTAITKIVPLVKDGEFIVATTSGGCTSGLAMLAWFLSNGTETYPDDGTARLSILRLDEPVEVYVGTIAQPTFEHYPYTAGSGADLALGAMEAGADAAKAALIACKHCNACGPPIESFDLKHRIWLSRTGQSNAGYAHMKKFVGKYGYQYYE